MRIMTAKAWIQRAVSKQKRRYQKDGFDLDLTYIVEPNIIAMGFPADKLEGVYRNHIEDVFKFLELKHKDHYRIYNLCAEKERTYDPTRFHNRVVKYPIVDHNPPEIQLIRDFCEDVHQWLEIDDRNVAAVHCKAGKGRTGVMICCYILYMSRDRTVQTQLALEHYGVARTKNGKGVTIPSQRRYVEYFGELLIRNLVYEPVMLLLKRIDMYTMPMFNNGSCNPTFTVSNIKHVKLFESQCSYSRCNHNTYRFDVQPILPVTGDTKVEFHHKNLTFNIKKMFHCWFNTFFLTALLELASQFGGNTHTSNNSRKYITKPYTIDEKYSMLGEVNREGDEIVLTLSKSQLDSANKDKGNSHFSPNFKITMYFDKPCSSRYVEHSRSGQDSTDRGSSPMMATSPVCEASNNLRPPSCPTADSLSITSEDEENLSETESDDDLECVNAALV